MTDTNQKSLDHRFFLLTAIALLLMVFLLFSSIIYGSFSNYISRDTPRYRNSLNTVNKVINRIGVYKLEGGQEVINEAVGLIDELADDYPFWKNEAEDINNSLSGAGREDTEILERNIKSLGIFARTIGDMFYANRKKYVLAGFIMSALLIFIALIILIGILVLRRDFSHYEKAVDDVLHELKDFIDFKNGNPDFSTEWKEVDRISQLLNSIKKEVGYIREISEMEIQGNLDRFMYQVHSLVEPLMSADRIAFAFLDSFDRVIAESTVVNGKNPVLKPGYTEELGATTLGKLVASGEARIINDLQLHYDTVNQSMATLLLLEEGVKSSMTMPVFIKERCIGFLFVSSFNKDSYGNKELDRLKVISQQLKHQLYFHYILQEMVAETARSFVLLMEKKDNETSQHIMRMSLYSHILANHLSKTNPEVTTRLVREILWFAPLHDIGKVGIPDNILQKTGKLTKEERIIMNTHVQIGEQVLARMNAAFVNILKEPVMQTAADLVSGHHEKYDGSGYPLGLSGKNIPIAGRIAAVADVFDALSSKRPYKEAYSLEKSMEIIKKGSGSHFDPEVISALEESLPEILKVYEKYKEI